MIMIRQDDCLLNSMSDLPFKEFGCAVMDVVYHGVMWPTEKEAEDGKGYTLKRDTFLEDCNQWRKSGALSFELDVTWNKIAQDIGLPYRLVFENGTHKLPPTRKLRHDEIQIVLLHNPETKKGHFVVMNKYDEVTYDSLGQSITVQAYEKGIAFIKERRIFRRIKNGN